MKPSTKAKNPPNHKKKAKPAKNGIVVSAAVAKDARIKPYFKILAPRSKYPGAVRIRGQDLVQNLKLPASNSATLEVPGFVYANLFLNPLEFSGTRIAKFGQLYEKYLFTDVKLKFQPCLPSSAKGSAGMSYDRDIDDPTPPASINGLRQFSSWPDTEFFRIWDYACCEGKLLAPEIGFYCDDHGREDRTAYQGQLYCFCEVPTAAGDGVQIGDLFLEYDIEFFIPALDAELPTAQFTNTGATVATASDIFKPFATAVAGWTPNPKNAVGTFAPWGLNQAGTGVVNLPEGLHRLAIQMLQTGGGLNNLELASGPTFTLLNPSSSNAAVGWKSIGNRTSTGAGDSATIDWLLNIPKGGVTMTSGATSLLGALGASKMSIMELDDYMDPNQFVSFAAGLV